MFKIEFVWRELLYRSIEKNNPYFTLTDIANIFKLSTSFVSYAILPLRELKMVEIGKKVSKIKDSERLLYFWATRRKIFKDIIYKTYSPLPVLQRETLMPAEVTPTAYSACRFYLNALPADYDRVYFYSKAVEKVKQRFPFIEKKEANIFILNQDPFLNRYLKIPLAQIFVDLWNLPDWYAKEYVETVLLKIKEKIGL